MAIYLLDAKDKEELVTKISNCVEKEDGKCLSTLDFTNEDKTTLDTVNTKVAEIEPNVHVHSNAAILDATTAAFTTAVNNLENYYLKSETYTKGEVDTLLNALSTLTIETVDTLPTTDISTSTIYLLSKTDTDEQNVYSEYINLDGTESGWECIGDTKVDLTDYAKTSDVETLISDELYNTTTIAAHYDVVDSTTENALEVVADGTATDGQIDISSVTPVLDGVTVTVGDYVVFVDETTTKNEKYAANGSAYTKEESDQKMADIVANSTDEMTYAEYMALSDEEKTNGTTYYITDVNSDGTVTGYTAGTGIAISDDKVITASDIKKNYIDNSNFRINTRGQSEYIVTDSSIYTVDRWYIDGGVLTPVENGVQLTNTNDASAGSASLIRLKQDMPYSFADFAGKTVTMSAKIDGEIYSGTATIPSEKPTDGTTAIQYITVGVPAFGINLNYSITGDYFVPYIALAYSRSVVIEWMKLEVNDKVSTYVEPDYVTEKIKTSFMGDNGKLNKLNVSKVLWSTDTYLSTGTINLSKDAAEYDELEIFTYYSEANQKQTYSTKWKNGTRTQINIVTQNDTNIQIIARAFVCSDDKLTITINDGYSMVNGSSAVTSTTNFLPYMVVGHKYSK